MRKARIEHNTPGSRVQKIRKDLDGTRFLNPVGKPYKKRLSQADFAEIIGWKLNTLNKIESDIRGLTRERAEKISAIAHPPASVEWIMCETDERNEQEAAVHAYIERLDDLQWNNLLETSVTALLLNAFEKQETSFTIECSEDAPAAVREKWDKCQISLVSQFGSVVNIWRDGAIVSTISVKEFDRMKRRLERLAEAIVSEYIEEGDSEDGER